MLALQSLMQRFVEFVKLRKTVELQEIAAEFGFRVQVRWNTSAMSEHHTLCTCHGTAVACHHAALVDLVLKQGGLLTRLPSRMQ